MHCESLSTIQKGAFMQPHMQLDPPGSLFLSNTKHIPSRHGRRLKTRAPENPHMQLDPPCSLFQSNPKYSPGLHGRRLKTRSPENALRAPFAHPKVPPKEGFGYN
uniref:Uncharacterized protein n=1 Tax=Anas platyrhynchos TaxID=8839 RepID=A0A8B9SGF0_ANAPL